MVFFRFRLFSYTLGESSKAHMVMWLIEQIAEKKIADAIKDGELDNLPGSGKPLCLEDDSMVPEELRTGYRLLKNSGFLPREIHLRNEITSVEQLINEASSAEESAQLNKRMHFLMMQLNLSHKPTSVWSEDYYANKLQAKQIKLT